MVPEPVADAGVDPLIAWLDDTLAGLADGVAECASHRDAGEMLDAMPSDAVRIDRIARLEKINAAAAA